MVDEDDAPGARAPRPFITSVRVEGSDGAGPHEWVSVWIRGQNVGTLCVGKGDGEDLKALLLGSAAELGFARVPCLPCPSDLTPDMMTLQLARHLGFGGAQLADEVERFIGYWQSRDARRVDWQAQLRRHLRQRFESTAPYARPGVPADPGTCGPEDDAITAAWREEREP